MRRKIVGVAATGALALSLGAAPALAGVDYPPKKCVKLLHKMEQAALAGNAHKVEHISDLLNKHCGVGNDNPGN